MHAVSLLLCFVNSSSCTARLVFPVALADIAFSLAARYALRGLLARLEAGLPADLMTAGSSGDPVRCEGGRMAPPSDNAVDIARLLTLRSECSPSLEGGTGAEEGDGDGGGEDWEFQRSLLMAEFDEGDRELGTLLSLLVSVSRGHGVHGLFPRHACGWDRRTGVNTNRGRCLELTAWTLDSRMRAPITMTLSSLRDS